MRCDEDAIRASSIVWFRKMVAQTFFEMPKLSVARRGGHDAVFENIGLAVTVKRWIDGAPSWVPLVDRERNGVSIEDPGCQSRFTAGQPGRLPPAITNSGICARLIPA